MTYPKRLQQAQGTETTICNSIFCKEKMEDDDFELDALLQYDLVDDDDDDDAADNRKCDEFSSLASSCHFDDAEFDELYNQSPIELVEESIPTSPRRGLREAKKLLLSPRRQVLAISRGIRRSHSYSSGESGNRARRTHSMGAKVSPTTGTLEPQHGVNRARSGKQRGVSQFLSSSSQGKECKPGSLGVLRGKSNRTEATAPEDNSFASFGYNSKSSIFEDSDEHSVHNSDSSSSVYCLEGDEGVEQKDEITVVLVEVLPACIVTDGFSLTVSDESSSSIELKPRPGSSTY